MRIRLPGTASSIALRYFEPAVDLRNHVAFYYLFRSEAPRICDVLRADLAQIRFLLSGTGNYELSGRPPIGSPQICLLGPSTMASGIDVVGPLAVFGISLLPAGWAALVRDDASSHANAVSDASDRFGPLLDDALDAMRAAREARAIVAIADVVLRAIVSTAAPPPLEMTRVVDAWLAGERDPHVDTLIADLGMSGRQVERLVKRCYGAPPKLLARKYRALRAASLIGATDVHWSDAAGDAYFDQSHFIRDFKRFIGSTPSVFQNDPSPLTRLTLQRRTVRAIIAPLSRIT